MLYPLKDLLQDAKRHQYAVGSFNFNDFDDACGMVMGAADQQAPIILMVSIAASKFNGIPVCVKFGEGLSQVWKVPVCMHLDHATDADLIRSCVDAGFSSVMIDASQEEFEENIRRTKEIVEYAHKRGCSVEAELGKIGGREENIDVNDRDAMMTDPERVPEFVERTGVDALAVAIGTAHGYYKSTPKIDFARLDRIAALTDCPLVLHGGTGIPEEDMRRAVRCGISKINVGTEFKARYTDAMKRAYAEKPEEKDPRYFMKAVREECRKAVYEKIEVFGGKGSAQRFAVGREG